MSALYYCGADQLTRLTDKRICSKLEKVDDNIHHLEVSLDLVVYSKSSAKFTWFVKGYPLQTPLEVFPDALRVNQVKICKSTIYGLSTVNNKLYKVDVNFSSNVGIAEAKFSEVTAFEENIEFLQIVTDDNSLFVLDNNSGIYKGPSLFFRCEGIKFIKIACGFDHVLLLSDTGAVYSFGNGSRGQLGLTDIVMRLDKPMRIEFFDDLPCTITDIVCGGWHSLVLTSDGDIYSFGWNPVGQLGHSAERLSKVVKDPYPVDLGSGENQVVGIASGARHSIALMQNGEIFCWGWNKYSQLGTGDRDDRLNPTLIKDCPLGRAFRVQASRWGTIIYCHHLLPP